MSAMPVAVVRRRSWMVQPVTPERLSSSSLQRLQLGNLKTLLPVRGRFSKSARVVGDSGTMCGVPREQSCSGEVRVGAARPDVARGSLAAGRVEPSSPNRTGRSAVAPMRRVFGVYDCQYARRRRSETRNRRLGARTSLLEALRKAGVNLHGRRRAGEAEIRADVELDVRKDDPCQCRVEAHLGRLDHGIVVIVRP